MALSIYLDTNVLVSTFVEDVFSRRADEFLKEKSDLLVSDFVRAEFASVMGRLFRTKELTLTKAESALQAFDEWTGKNTALVEMRTYDIRAAEDFLRSFGLGLRAPDAINIAIARRMGAELATFDKKMAQSARKLGISVAKV